MSTQRPTFTIYRAVEPRAGAAAAAAAAAAGGAGAAAVVTL